MSGRGAMIVGIGQKALGEARLAEKALRQSNPGLEVCVVQRVEADAGWNAAQLGRWAKMRLDVLSPFEETVYLDADTRAQADLGAGFKALEEGFDLALAFSENQGSESLWHVEEDERRMTRREMGFEGLQLQAGVMFVRRCEETHGLFKTWREEWLRFRGQDQAALMRALLKKPVRLWVLGRPWNGGTVVQHLFGRCR